MRTEKRFFVDWRLYERVLLILLVAIVAAAMLDKARDLRAQAELGVFQYNLSALRVALVIEQMRAVTGKKPAAALDPNPFKLVNSQLVNYNGEMLLAEAMTGALPRGAWFYDGRCSCIGYRPTDDRRFVSPTGSGLLIFNIQTVSGENSSASAPVAMLTAREPYLWWGELIR